MEGHDFFCEVDRSFIGKGATTVGGGEGGLPCNMPAGVGHDSCGQMHNTTTESRFNLYGIQSEVTNFNDGLNIILDYVSSDSSSGNKYKTLHMVSAWSAPRAAYARNWAN